jgi:pyruvate,water dikinase
MDTELRDPTHGTSEPGRYWSTSNIGEAMPDVLSPMCWSFWGPNMEAGARLAYHDFGILPTADLAVPDDPNQLLTAYFFGRPAMNLDRLRSLFGAIPGMTADDFERDVCGHVREGLPPETAPGRALHVLARGPAGLALAGRRVARYEVEQRAWWERDVFDTLARDHRALLAESAARFREAFRIHVRGRFVLMTLQAQLTKMATDAGREDLVVRLLAGVGGVAETTVSDELWQVGRQQLALTDFLRRHGFHGPLEGNLTGVSWREDPNAVRALAESLAARPDRERPREREAAMVAARKEAIDELTATLPRHRRAGAKGLCAATGRAVRTTELGKGSFLMALDGGRAATRAIGRELHEAGAFEDPEDAFYLTIEELTSAASGDLPVNVAELLRFRRERREEYRRYDLPLTFTGMPLPVVREDQAPEDARLITGVAGAPGSVEGRARVVVDPFSAEPLEPGEILVCRFTDPSWAPLFALADALVIDIGAAASHGAIVARELGVPCVIGTGDGTRRISTGDRLRVDGNAGRVEILDQA